MTKKDFIALADAIKSYNQFAHKDSRPIFDHDHLELLSDFCYRQNQRFNEERWIAYIAGKCGQNGGKVK